MMLTKLVVLVSLIQVAHPLSDTGRNVCGTTRTEAFIFNERYTTKCGSLGWRRCTRYRGVTRYKTAIDYNCCTGWTSTDNVHCDVARCFGQLRVCPNGGTCILPDVCSCRPGFIPARCDDIDECATANGGCSHGCVNTMGSYHCTCPSSFGLTDDTLTCAPICNGLSPGVCPNDGECINPGECYCTSGFSEPNCEDTDECDDNNGGCSSICVNTEGSYRCECDRGYGLLDDRRTCQAICQTLKPGLCPNQGTCIAPYICECTTGFAPPSCSDINECSNSSGGCQHVCVNTHGSHQCACRDGYGLLEDQQSCLPICYGLGPGLCDNGGTCIEPMVCQCLTGYSLPNCTDIDECEKTGGGCSDICENSIGSYSCDCFSGYRLMEDHHICTDIIECDTMNGGCSQICQNYPGNYNCSCFKGYSLADNGVTCQDIDECTLLDTRCEDGCINIPGVYVCSCPMGYRLKNDGVSCEDIDECVVINGGCSGGCVNSPGSFHCTCEAGFMTSKDNRTCVDLDECTDGTAGCSHLCIDELGSFQCVCPFGFTLSHDNQSCIDTDECEGNNAGCDDICSNTDGSYRCTCNPGFILSSDEHTCDDASSCPWSGDIDCWPSCTPDVNDACSCPKGHVLHGDGDHCIDPCFSSPCKYGGVCSPAISSYQCDCSNTGYDGINCQAGVVTLPDRVNVRAGELSDAISIKAHPEGQIIIRAYSSAILEVSPNPIIIKFPSTESSFRLLAPQRGRYTLHFNVSGSDTFKSISSLGIDAEDVFTRLNLPNDVLPNGSFFSDIRFEQVDFQFSSTSPWYRLNVNPNTVFTRGVTYTASGSFSLPISLSGFEITVGDKLLMGPISSFRIPEDGTRLDTENGRVTRQAQLDLSPADINDFIHKRSIFQTLFNRLRSKLPPWLRFETVKENVLPSEYFEFNIYQGSRVQRIPSCQSAPLQDELYYHVFRFTHAIIVSIMGQRTTLPDADRNAEYCLILDIKNDYGTTFIIMFPDKAAVFLQELELFRKLKESTGIAVYPKGIGLSFKRELNVHRRITELTFWNGDELFQYPVDETATFWAAINANKTIDVNKTNDFAVATSAEMFLAAPDITKVFTHLFVDPWNILLRLSSSFDVMFKVKISNKVYPIYLKSLLKIDLHAYASVGGQIERHYCGQDANPPGAFLAANVDTTALRGIPIVEDILFTATVTAYVFKSFDAMSTQDIVSPEEIFKALLQSVKTAASRLLEFLKSELKRLGQLLVSWAFENLFELQGYVKQLLSTISNFKLNRPKLIMSDLADITKDVMEHIQRIDGSFDDLKERLSLFFESFLDEFMLKVDNEIFLLKQTASNLVKNLYTEITSLLQGSSSLGIRGRFSITIFGYFLAIQGEFVDSDVGVGLCGQFRDFYEHLHGQGAIRIFGLLERKFSIFDSGDSLGDKIWHLLKIQVGGGLEVALARESSDFVVRFHGRLNFFGFRRSTTDIFITNKGIYSRTENTLWNLYKVRVTLGAEIFVPVSQWVLRVRGEFLPVGDSLEDGLGAALRRFSKQLADNIVKRLNSAQEGLKVARDKLSNAQNWLQDKKKDVDRANVFFDRAIAKLEVAKQRLEAAKEPFERALEKLRKAQKRIDGLCRIRSCRNICIPGIRIRICKKKFGWVRIPYPCIKLTSCMLKVPDFVCHGKNALCKAVRGIAYAALEAAKLFVRIPIVALDVAKGALSIAQIAVDKSRVVLDAAKLILDVAKLGLEAAKATLDAARIAIEVVKIAVKTAQHVFELILKYGVESIIDVKQCGFQVELSTEDLLEFEIFCQINPFKLGWRQVHFRLNFGNILTSLWNVAKDLVDKFFGEIKGILGKRKRSIEFQTYHTLHTIFRNRRAANTSPFSSFGEEAVLMNSTDDKIIPIHSQTNINDWIELCRQYRPLFEFLHMGVEALKNVTLKMITQVEEVKGNSSHYAMMLNMTAGLSTEDAEVDFNIAYEDFNLTRDDIYKALNDTNPDDDEIVQASKNATQFVLLQNDEAANVLSSFQIVSIWKSEMENSTKEYLNTSECAGHHDCVVWAFGQIYELLESVDPQLVSVAKDNLPKLETRYYDLLGNDSRNIEEVKNITTDMMDLINVVDTHDIFCGTVPSFIEHPANITAREGTSVTLTCNAESIPSPGYYWYKDDIFVGVSSSSLTFSNVSLIDDGLYTCVAGNHVANVSSTSARISVIYGARLNSPLPSNVFVVSGNELLIEYDTVANPAPEITWRSTAPHPPVSHEALYMSGAQVTASGLYLYVTSNEYGSDYSNEMLLDIRKAHAACSTVAIELGFVTKRSASGEGVLIPMIKSASLSDSFTLAISGVVNEVTNQITVQVTSVLEAQSTISLVLSVGCSDREACVETTCAERYTTSSRKLQSGVQRIQNIIRDESALFNNDGLLYYFNTALFEVGEELRICPLGFAESVEYTCTPSGPAFIMESPKLVGTLYTEGVANLSWEPPTHSEHFLKGYSIEVIPQDKHGETVRRNLTADVSYFTLNESFRGKTYNIRVRAFTASYNGDWLKTTVDLPELGNTSENWRLIVGLCVGIGLPLIIAGVLFSRGEFVGKFFGRVSPHQGENSPKVQPL